MMLEGLTEIPIEAVENAPKVPLRPKNIINAEVRSDGFPYDKRDRENYFIAGYTKKSVGKEIKNFYVISHRLNFALKIDSPQVVREDLVITPFYNPNNPSFSFLHHENFKSA